MISGKTPLQAINEISSSLTMPTANDMWVAMLDDVLARGKVCSPRGLATRELLAYTSTVDMRQPAVTVRLRKISRKFLGAESYWIISGDNRVDTIAPYNKRIAQFSDDGIYFNGAYGPMLVEQLSYVTDQLAYAPETRQAVLTTWRPNPRPSKDIPCTIGVQWLLRDHIDSDGAKELRLYCILMMRSSDGWLGWPYDIFNFSMLSAYVALMLRQKAGLLPQLGSITLLSGSQHLYDVNWEQARTCIDNSEAVAYRPLHLAAFESPSALLKHLAALRDGDRTALVTDFLSELIV